MSPWWKIWWVALAVKLALTGWLPLSPDEAYYLVWANHLQLSYFDHPPMVAWLMWLGSILTPFAVRWPAVVLGHLGLVIWSRLFARWFSPKQQLWWLCLALFMPLIGPGSLIVTPDLPLFVTWGLTLLAAQRFIDQPQLKSAILLGLSLGLTALSKYHAILLLPIIALWWRQHRPFRETLRWLVPLGITVLILLSPVLIWNYQHDWASFRFQISHGLGRNWKPSWTSEYLLAQLGLLFPTVLWAAWHARKEKAFLIASMLPLIFFGLTSFRGYVEANWPLPSHPMILGMAVLALPRFSKWLMGTVVLWAGLLTAIIILFALPNWPAALEKTKLFELREFETLAQTSAEFSPLYARSYQMASWLSYRWKRPIYKLSEMNRRDFFDSLSESTPQEDSFYLIVQPDDVVPPAYQSWSKIVVKEIGQKFEIWQLVKP